MGEGGVRYACQCMSMCELGPEPTDNGQDHTVSSARGPLERVVVHWRFELPRILARHNAASRTCVPNSTPMVGFPSRNVWPSLSSTNRCIRCDLPTPESPTRTTACRTRRARW